MCRTHMFVAQCGLYSRGLACQLAMTFKMQVCWQNPPWDHLSGCPLTPGSILLQVDTTYMHLPADNSWWRCAKRNTCRLETPTGQARPLLLKHPDPCMVHASSIAKPRVSEDWKQLVGKENPMARGDIKSLKLSLGTKHPTPRPGHVQWTTHPATRPGSHAGWPSLKFLPSVERPYAAGKVAHGDETASGRDLRLVEASRAHSGSSEPPG